MSPTKITSLIEYLKCIESPITINGFVQDHILYRGQSNAKWGLVPSVFRDIDGQYYDERQLILEAQRRCWKWLQDCNSDLERLIKLQHYGLCTRLLDFTSNPLVALFFACCFHYDQDGIVFCSTNNLSNIELANLMTKIIINHDMSESNISDEKLLRYANNSGLSIDANIIRNALSNILLIKCPYNNDRISNQNGFFAIAPLYDKQTKCFIHAQPLDLSESKYGLDIGKRIVIESTSKKMILKELEKIGISEGYIFPDLEHTLKSINKSQQIKPSFKLDI